MRTIVARHLDYPPKVEAPGSLLASIPSKLLELCDLNRELHPMELQAPARAFAEVEMPNGVKLRLYSGTLETMDFLASMFGSGSGR